MCLSPRRCHMCTLIPALLLLFTPSPLSSFIFIYLLVFFTPSSLPSSSGILIKGNTKCLSLDESQFYRGLWQTKARWFTVGWPSFVLPEKRRNSWRLNISKLLSLEESILGGLICVCGWVLINQANSLGADGLSLSFLCTFVVSGCWIDGGGREKEEAHWLAARSMPPLHIW